MTFNRQLWLGAVITGTLATFSFLPHSYAASAMPIGSKRLLSLMPSGPIRSKSTVTFQVSSPGSTDHHMLYQFWVQTQKGWSMIQDYSSKDAVSVPLNSGSYIVAVYRLTQSQFDGHQFSQAQIALSVVNLGSRVQLSAGAAATKDQAMTFEANATNLIEPVYQFWVENPDGQWTSSGGYQSSSSFRYVPPMAGTYRVIVYAKDKGAPNNGKDSIWSPVQRVQAAPAQADVATVATQLNNPLPALDNSHALLLGQSALVSCTVKDAQGNPLVDVPVEFTLTNDSNPSDHVSLPQGLNDRVITNAQGTAESVLSLTNPENGNNSGLATDSQAVARVTYQVTVPSAPGTAATNTVLFAALDESGTAVANATGGVETTQSLGSQVYRQQYAISENIDDTSGKALSLSMPASFILPASSDQTATTLSVDDNSQALGPLETWSPQAITIPEGFSRAQLDLDRLDLSQGSVFQMTFTPNSGGTPYIRTISGAVNESSTGIDIPEEMRGGTLSFRLSTPSFINPKTASGVKISSLSWHTLSGSVVRVPVPQTDTTWQSTPVTYSVATDLSGNQAQEYLGSYYRSQASYQIRVPLYPEVGDGVISEVLNHNTVSDFLVPSVNNGNNQNVPTDAQAVLPVAPGVMDTLPKVDWSSSGTVMSTQSGGAEFLGHLHIPGTDMTWPVMRSYAAFVPGVGSTPSYPSSWALSGQRITLTAQVTDGFGNPAPLGTPLQWSVPAQFHVLSRQNATDGQGQAQIVLEATGSAQGTVKAESMGYQVKLSDKGAQGTSLALRWLPLHFSFKSTSLDTYATSSTQSVMSLPIQTLNASNAYDLGIQVLAGNEPLSGYSVEMDNEQGLRIPIVSNSQGIAQWPIAPRQYPGGTWTIKSVSSSVPTSADLTMLGSPDSGQGSVAGFPELRLPLSWQSQSSPALSWYDGPPSLADTGTKVPFTVVARDASGNPLVDDPISFSLLGQKTATLSSNHVSTNAQGLAQTWILGGQAGEEDTLEVQSSETTGFLSTPLNWLAPAEGSEMVPLSLSINAASKPNILTLAFSRKVDPESVLSNGSQFLVKNPDNGAVYQVGSAHVQGSQVILTLANSNPGLSAASGIQVSVIPITDDGIQSVVMDSYQEVAASGAVTAFSPSAPEITATAQNGDLTITVSNHGSSIPSGQSVVIMPQSVSGSVAGLPGGKADVLVTSGTATQDSWKIAYKDQDGANVTYLVSFDGKVLSVRA